MLQDMDRMDANCILYVKVGMFDELEQNKICVLTITALGIAMLTIHHDLILSICVIQHHGYVLGQTSPDVLSVEECPVYILQSRDFCCCLAQFVPVNKHTTWD